jgi:aminoglycoside 3-N-acetyltransferase
MLDYEITDADGRIFTLSVRSHNFEGWVQRYDRLAEIVDRGALRSGSVLQADCYLIEAAAMWSAAHKKLQEDPLFFVDRDRDENG